MKTLFVCTGNTCRSPMAEALCRAMGHEAFSAGLRAMDGEGASKYARAAMEARGLDISGHRAKSVTDHLMAEAELVICMTEAHAFALAQRFPRYRGKIGVMPRPIPDPYGGSPEDYLRCADAIAEGLAALEEMGTL